MRCPRCGHAEDKVIDSRAARNDAVIRRRRVCQACGKRFTTYEEVVKPRLQVVKRDGRREEFDRRKLAAGIMRACEKRPVSAAAIESMVDGIVDQLESEFEGEIPSERIGRAVMERLETTDDVAYVRFASVYRRFQDLNQFLSAIEGLIKKQ
ncbi:MAG: transcriptional repressor NrdR [Lentisphaerae bacterium]|nr:transcriptional repressor NrdR [Lentisphaerota bacterium]